MQKKRSVLVAVDGSESAMDAVRYVSRFFLPGSTRITLIHILSELPEALEDYKGVYVRTPGDDRWEEELQKKAAAMMDLAAAILRDAGFDGDAVKIEVRSQVKGVAKDLIAAAGTGFDAVFVGRRGVNEPTDMIVGSTAYRLVSGIAHLPVVVVGDQPDPRHVLIGFDGSEDAFKGVDCACKFMPRPERRAVLCHVIRSVKYPMGDDRVLSREREKEMLEKTRERIENALTDARVRLIEAGFAPGLIFEEILEGKISRAVSISRTAESNGCGTIVVGRRGLTVIKDFLMGRVSMKILHKAHKMAVWIV